VHYIPARGRRNGAARARNRNTATYCPYKGDCSYFRPSWPGGGFFFFFSFARGQRGVDLRAAVRGGRGAIKEPVAFSLPIGVDAIRRGGRERPADARSGLRAGL